MRLKTYLATYLLFLLVLFSCFGIISAYMTRSKINMYLEKCTREFDTIAHTLFRDLFVLADRDGMIYTHNLDRLLEEYEAYYRQHNITFTVTYISYPEEGDIETYMTVSFVPRNGERYIHISGALPEPFSLFRLDYYYSMSANLADMQNIHNMLLFVCITFSIITACILYFVLSGIFKPLSIVSKASEKIASGHYGERIHIGEDNELSLVVKSFNRMAQEVESQIQMLEDEAFAKQRFIDNFAHEIRTPLTSIYGNAEYMQRASLEEGEIVEYTQFIMDKATHMKQIANSLLQLATLRKYTPVKSEIQLKLMFDDIEKTMRKTANAQKLKFTCKSEVDVLYGQEDLIKSLLLNLCSNAFKACTPDEGIVSLEAKKQDKYIEIIVADNGCGIPTDSLSKVIEPFYQVNDESRQRKGGTGLGLAICSQIAEAHGAKMVIESLSGEGTTVKTYWFGCKNYTS